MATLSASYAVRHFAITTDVNELISQELPWRQREKALLTAFPQREELILAVVEARTPELVQQATEKLAAALSEQPNLFRAVLQPGSGAFFEQNGLLFLPTEEVARTTRLLTEAEPLLGTLAEDPSLRGVMDVTSFGVLGVQRGMLKLDDLVWPYSLLSDSLDNILAGRPATFSWRALMNGRPSRPDELRRFIEIRPALDYSALEPGSAATEAIRKTVADLKLGPELGARVRLTGPVPLADEEFATVKENAFLNSALTIAAVLVILWLALRSGRIILSVFVALMVGLAATAGLGLFLVGALNLISIAFAVLFVGLGVDFGIQFTVRYRAERHDVDDLPIALHNSAMKAGLPLALAAAATTAGFFSFLPTDYRGLSELGLIAGCGMIIAFVTSITVLPAMLRLLNPPGEQEPVGYAALAPVDRFMERRRMPILIGTGLTVLLGAPLLFHVTFDFNPLNLRSPKVESVATFLELRRDPATGTNAIEILAPTLPAAMEAAKRLAALPEVSRTMTLASFVPDQQDEKLALIREAATALEPTLNPAEVQPPPTDEEVITALRTTASELTKAVGQESGPGVTAVNRLAGLLTRLADADPAMRAKAEAVLIPPLKVTLDQLRDSLKAQPISLETLPPDLAGNWVTPDGRARVEVTAKGDPNDNETLRRFAAAVLAVEPTATGMPISIQEAGRTVVHAFIESGAWALVSIAVLLWIVLRRFSDVLLTLVPLILAGVVTLELSVLIGLPLNFANIIALPLLLGVGVAFKIYYIMAWRAGKTNLLQSSLTRAVIFSSMTTAAAFGSLSMSSHPGTASMGKLLALSLVCTLAAAVLFQPVLMGRPRNTK